ncbi:MAG: ribonuclease P protein component [Acidobacteriota bacterium]|nr:ribonuclease P protein component [Acidobacteriota bacterium]
MEERDSPRNDFPKSNRLRKPKEFRNVFNNGQKVVTHTLVFHVLRTALGASRLGLAVSRKVGKATRRNKVKRRIREVFRVRKHDFPGDYDMVVYPRRGVLEKSFQDYESSFDTLISILERRRKGKDKSPRK